MFADLGPSAVSADCASRRSRGRKTLKKLLCARAQDKRRYPIGRRRRRRSHD
ncbi:hypothetical protein BSIN_1843 [Burkholderia singularis]|uniref:Uncharacterized protein n=2 Tax=Burkholderia singularis TaxID=1503053 RepID=A0A238H021_9BURK|nr:hypothetical protein BSIN_1843 [Burkholderia singularis]